MLLRLVCMTLIFLVSFGGVANAATPGIPGTMNYQGRLTDLNGDPIADGLYQVGFRLWDDPVGGNLLWQEIHGISTENGLFTALLGQGTSLHTVDFDQHIWLGTEVGPGTGELMPRVRLASTAYSFIASELQGGAVNSLNGLGGAVSLVPGTNMSITPSGNSLILNAGGGGGGSDADWGINGDDMYALPSGNVGIGTTTPNHGLHVVGSGVNGVQMSLEDVTDTGQQTFQLSTFWVRTALATGQISMTTTNSGNKQFMMYAQSTGADLLLRAADQVTLNHNNLLRIQRGSVDVADFNDDDEMRFWDGEEATVIIRAADPNLGTDGGEILLENNAGVQTVRLDGYRDGNRGGTVGLYGETGNFGILLHGQKNASNDGGFAEFFNESGNRTIQAAGQNGTGAQNGGWFALFRNDGVRTVELEAAEDGSNTQGSTLKLYNDSGQLTLELDADHGSSNQGRVITDILEITGGSDLSEQFDIADRQVEPGHVVSIDPANPGELRMSSGAYDTRVAGVVSGAGGVRPGMLMGQRGSEADGAHPVALTGRVYVKVDASYGSVEPGDLLTTSDTPGHAMKIGDRDRAAGAILGKAMGSLENGRGLVLVLVSLQ